MDSEYKKELDHFCSRVECIQKSIHSPMPAKEISNNEIVNVIYMMIQEKRAEEKRLKKLSKKFLKDIKDASKR